MRNRFGCGLRSSHWSSQIKELEALRPFEVVFWPMTTRGERLQFPVCLRRGEQTLDPSMPLLLVKDFVLPVQGEMPAYASLQDPLLATKLDEEGTRSASGAVHIPGTLLDLVGSTSPQPENAKLVTALNILGPPDGDPFVPSLGRAAQAGQEPAWAMRVDLPGLRTLLGEATPEEPATIGTAVRFARDYLDNGEAAKVLFESVSEMAVDFTRKADRSGGLMALQLAADGHLTRARAGPGGGVGQPGSGQGDRLSREAARRQAEGPGRRGAGTADTRFQAERGRSAGRRNGLEGGRAEGVATPAHLGGQPADAHRAERAGESADNLQSEGLRARLPPRGEQLLELTLDELSYLQDTARGADAPPQIDLKGLGLNFLGPLELLGELQKVSTSATPSRRSTPCRTGSASLVLPLPSVRCVAFLLSNVVFHATVDTPFRGDPPR